jgi:hypothetical protein
MSQRLGMADTACPDPINTLQTITNRQINF